MNVEKRKNGNKWEKYLEGTGIFCKFAHSYWTREKHKKRHGQGKMKLSLLFTFLIIKSSYG